MQGWLTWVRDHWPFGTVALRIQRSGTFCEGCGAVADMDEHRHLTRPGSPDPGCGRRYSHVYVEYDLLTEGSFNRLKRQHAGVPVTKLKQYHDPDSPSGKSWQDYEE